MFKAAATAIAIVIVTSLTTYRPAVSRHILLKGDMCASCNVSRLPYGTFKARYLGACLVCGEFYGSETEHCCMCHAQWFDDCLIATVGDAILRAEDKVQ